MVDPKAPASLHYEAFHDHGPSIKTTLPHMELRFQNLTLSTPITITTIDGSTTHVLPTIPNDLKNAAKPNKTASQTTKNILNDVSGVFKPGSMTLVLGQPGAGKSALLRILSGRFPLSKALTLVGQITYNGVTREELLQSKRMPQFVSYVAQRDQHFPTLTVKETLEFAQVCCGSIHDPHVVTQQLGLQHCADTVIGDDMLRGVSGGERKRVTLGEMEFGNNLVAFMDEISTGLDSAATFDIVTTQRGLAKNLNKTIVMALLQPGPEVFELFDDVMLLAEGHVMYHGPRDQVVSYFESLGLACPRDRDIADFLIDIGTAKQAHYLVASGSHAYGDAATTTPAELAATFRESAIFQSMCRTLETPIDAAVEHGFEDWVHRSPEFHQAFWPSTWKLIQREVRTTWRNTNYLLGRLTLLVVVGLIDASLFYSLDLKNIQSVLGAVAAVILYIVLTQPGLSPVFVAGRAIFYKQRDANFYRSSSYVIAVALNQMLLILPESLITSALVYWMFGLVGEVSAFVGFATVLFLSSSALCGYTFLMSTICSTSAMVESVSTLVILLFTLFSGLFISRANIPVYFTWAYWSNPIAWALRTISVQQYGSERFDTCVYDDIDYCALYGKRMGTYTLESFDIYPEQYWFWVGLAFLVAMCLGCFTVSIFVLETVRHQSEATHENTAMQIQAESHVAPCFDGKDSYECTTPNAVHIAVETPRTTRHCVTPVTLAFENLRYSVSDPANKGETLELLKGISGFAKPGTITALMGSSGAGKTTLMDVIAGRKTGGTIQGRILLNGYEASDLVIRRATGYCEQMNNNHSEAATVREALTFSAFLRQSADVSDADKLDAVEECLDVLDLRPIADKVIRGSSVEQMKRIAIGVELAAHTSVLFLDEPTSGLDARAAKLVMDAVRKVADLGRTVVCTVHQPSWEVVQDFDSLLLLKRGGEAVFFGEFGADACELITYFESIHGVTPMEIGANPATWMLDVIGAGIGSGNAETTAIEATTTTTTTLDFVSIFQASEKQRQLNWQLDQDGVTRPALGVPALSFSSSHAASHFVQAKWLLTRCIHTYWRSTEYNVTRIVIALVLALIFGLAFGKTQFETFKGLYTVVTMVGVAMVFLSAVSFDCVIPFVVADRAAFYRESASQTYHSLWYCVATTLVEIPYVFAMSLIFSAVFFPLAGFTGALQFVLFWIHFALYLLLQTYIGQTIAFAAPSVEVAVTMGLLVTSIAFLFMGFNPPSTLMPSGYKWLHTIVPPKYTLSILTSVIVGDCSDPTSGDLGCLAMQDAPPTLPANITNAEYLELVFDIKRSDLWTNFAVIMGYIVLTRVVALLVLRFVRHGNR